MTCEQLDLLVRNEEKEQADAKVLTRHLYLACDWRTRNQISEALDWKCHARIRHAAEAAERRDLWTARHAAHSPLRPKGAGLHQHPQSQVDLAVACATREEIPLYGKGPL